MNVPIDEAEALDVFDLVMESLLTLARADGMPGPLQQGMVLLADEILGRVWPLINVERLGSPACDVRWLIAARAAEVCQHHHLLEDAP